MPCALHSRGRAHPSQALTRPCLALRLQEEKLKARGGGLTSQTMARVNKERLQVLLDDVKGGGKDSTRYATSLECAPHPTPSALCDLLLPARAHSKSWPVKIP